MLGQNQIQRQIQRTQLSVSLILQGGTKNALRGAKSEQVVLKATKVGRDQYPWIHPAYLLSKIGACVCAFYQGDNYWLKAISIFFIISI